MARYRRRSLIVAANPTIRARIDPMGGIEWGQAIPGMLSAAYMPHDPSPEDWAALARRLASDLDGWEKETEAHLEELQSGDPDASTALEWAAEVLGAVQCGDCRVWAPDGALNEDRRCGDCEQTAAEAGDYCNCRGGDCGTCRNASGPI